MPVVRLGNGSKGSLAPGRAPGKQSETCPGSARRVPECSRAAKFETLAMGPGVMEIREADNPKIVASPTHSGCLVSVLEAL